VQKDKSVSTSAFQLSDHDSLYSLSAKAAVPMVLTLGQKSTNIQSTEFHKFLANNTVPAFLFGDSMICHFLVEAFIIISHDASLRLQDSSHFDMFKYVRHVHIYFMSPTF
jgi:hypothetical protein